MRNQHEGARRTASGNRSVQTVERHNIAVGETEEFIHPHLPHDAFYLTDEQRAERGLSDAVPSCVADLVYPPGHPQQGEFVFPGAKVFTSVTPPAVADRVSPAILTSKQRTRPSFKFARWAEGTEQAGQLVSSLDDQVYATYDRDEYLNKGTRSQAYLNEAAYNFTDSVSERNLADPITGQGHRNFEGNQRDIQAEKTRTKDFMGRIAKTGRRYPPTMTIDEMRAAETKHDPDAILREERKWARGGRSERPGEYDAYEQKMAEMHGKKASRSKSVSYPGSPTK